MAAYLSKCEDVDELSSHLNSVANNKMNDDGAWDDAIGIFNQLLALSHDAQGKFEPWIHSNALYALQYDNNGLPVNRELNDKFLSICLPYVRKNAGIYFCAAALYVEMNEFDKALDCFKKYFASDDEDRTEYIAEFKTHKMFAEFRKYPKAAALMKTI